MCSMLDWKNNSGLAFVFFYHVFFLVRHLVVTCNETLEMCFQLLIFKNVLRLSKLFFFSFNSLYSFISFKKC